MTAYFDDLRRAIYAVTPENDEWASYPQLEHKMVFDATVAAQLPGFPADLARRVHETILKHGVSHLPPNAPEPDFEEMEEYRRRLANMCSDLHDIFHALAHRRGPGFDDPLAGLRALYDEGADVRERMVDEGS